VRSALAIEQFVARERDLGQVLVVYRLQIGVEGGGHIGTLHLHDQLTLVDEVAQPDVQRHHAAVGQGEHRNLTRDIGVDRAGHLQRAQHLPGGGLHQRKARRALHVDHVAVPGLGYGRLRRSFGGGVRIALLAAAQSQQQR
jgi:hypothetical protein